MESITLRHQDREELNGNLAVLSDAQINTALSRSHTVERLVCQSSLKIKPEVVNSLQELRHIIQLQSLQLSGHIY